jgi:hypothetical protein
MGIGITAPLYKLHVVESTNDTATAFVNNTNAAFTGDILSLNTTTAAAGTFNFVRGYANTTAKFKIDGNGAIYNSTGTVTVGADYAEYFESVTGNELTIGRCVVMDNDKIRYYNVDTDVVDTIIGVIRPKNSSTVVGNAAWSHWSNRYLKDDFGSDVMGDYHVYSWEEQEMVREAIEEVKEQEYVPAVIDAETKEVITPEIPYIPADEAQPATYKTVIKQWCDYQALPDGETKESIEAKPSVTVTVQKRQVENPDYDPNTVYIPREDRSEWNIVGLMGQVPVRTGETVNPRWILMKNISVNANMYLIR